MLDETVTSNSLNSMPHLSNILQILSKNDPLRVRIVSIIVSCPKPLHPVHVTGACLCPVSIAMDKYHKHSVDLGVFLPLVKGAAIICCTCTQNRDIYSIYEALTSAQLESLPDLYSGYNRVFPRKLKINIL